MFLNSELPYQGEAILRNGTTTTTASIPFALGLSVPDSLYSPSGTSKGLLIGGTGPGANSTYYGQGTLELVDYNFLGTKLRYVLFGSSAVTSGPGLGFLASAGSTSASTQPGGNLRFTGGNNTDGVTGGSGGNVTFVAGAGRGATYKGGVVELVGGTASASATYGYISIGNTTFGTPDKINLTSSDAFKSLYVNKHLEVDGTTYLDGALNVVGTTTLATSLTGLAQLTAGVVSATSTPSVTSILVGNGTAAAPSIAFASDTNTGIYRVGADALGVSAGGVLQTTTSTNGLTIANTLNVNATSDFAQATRVDYNHGYGFSNLSGDRPAGLIGDGSSNEIIQLAANTTQAASNFAVFGYSLSTGNQGSALRLDTRSGFPTFSLWLQDNQDNLGGGGGTQYPVIQLSGSQGRLGLGTGHALDTDTFYGTVDISPKTNEVALYIRQEPGAGADITQWVNVGGAVRAYIDKSWNFSTAGDVLAGGSVTATALVSGATASFATGASSTSALTVGTVPTFKVDTTNNAIGVGVVPSTTVLATLTDNTKTKVLETNNTLSTRATGFTTNNLIQTLSWTSGQGVSTGINTLGVSLTDNHKIDSTFNDIIRLVNLSTNRTSTYTYGNNAAAASTVTLSQINSSFTDSGTITKNSNTTTVNATGVIAASSSFNPTYNESSAAKTLNYNGTGISYNSGFFPTITNVGSLIVANLRGLHISGISGSTGSGVTSTVTGIELGGINTAATAYGIKIGTTSASTTVTGIDISGISTATTSYGIKIAAVTGVTTAYGLAIAAPTTATNKYAIAIDGTGGDSAINFNTPTRAGVERVYSGSTGQLTLEGGTSVAINKGYLYLTGSSADPTNGFQMYFYKPNYDLSASGKYGGFGEWHVTTPGANGFYGLQFTAQTDHTSGTQSGGMSAVNANVNIFHTGTGADSGSHNAGNYQITNYSALNSSGTWTAILGRIANNAAGNINVARSFSALNYLSGAGNVTTSINYYAQGFSDGGAGALTNNYGIYVEELTAGSTINREIFIAGAGGTYFRDGNQKIYSSAASTLDVTANTTYQERIGGTVQTTLTSDLLTLKDSFNIAVNTGTGTKIGTSSAQKIGLWNATPVAQHSSTGETVGFTAGAGTNVTDASTFTGNVGATAYRISDIVKALKNAGIMAQ